MSLPSDWHLWTRGERLVVSLLAGLLVIAALVVVLRMPPEPAKPNKANTSLAKQSSPTEIPRVVSINRASREELQALPGIGPDLARRIIEDRTRRGPFTSVEDLARVKGIGPSKVEQLRGFISL